MWLRKLLGLSSPDPRPRHRLVAAVQDRLAHLAPQRAEFVAAFAGLLVRVAHADAQLSDAERAALPALVAEQLSLSDDESAAVAGIVAQHADAFAGIEYAALTRIFNELAGEEDKEQLIACLYAVATAGSLVSLIEDEEIRAVSRALLMPHSRFIAVRSRFKDKLEVMQALPRRQRR